jgi:hypothetical protein
MKVRLHYGRQPASPGLCLDTNGNGHPHPAVQPTVLDDAFGARFAATAFPKVRQPHTITVEMIKVVIEEGMTETVAINE